MGTRHPDKDMTKSWKHFDTSVKLCKQAHTAGKVARFKGLLETLQTTYYKFEEDFEVYKQDTIGKTCKTETAFNAEIEEDGEQKPAYPYNDAWCEDQMTSMLMSETCWKMLWRLLLRLLRSLKL